MLGGSPRQLPKHPFENRIDVFDSWTGLDGRSSADGKNLSMTIFKTMCAMAVLSVVAIAAVPAGETAAFDCAETSCKQIKTCAEAHYKLTICGHTKRDADGDGIPCEDICGKDTATYLARVKAQAPENDVADKSKPTSVFDLVTPAEAAENNAQSGNELKCQGKRTCKQMESCEEAKFYLASCGVKSLDGDHDGVPCNALCR